MLVSREGITSLPVLHLCTPPNIAMSTIQNFRLIKKPQCTGRPNIFHLAPSKFIRNLELDEFNTIEM